MAPVGSLNGGLAGAFLFGAENSGVLRAGDSEYGTKHNRNG
jgi:hypothetical protein